MAELVLELIGCFFPILWPILVALWGLVIQMFRAAASSVEGSLSDIEAAISTMEGVVATPPSRMRDRLSAALAHWLIVVAAIPFAVVVMWLPATILWVWESRRLEWPAFQALQAAVYQFLVSLVTTAGVLIFALLSTPFFQSRDPTAMAAPAYHSVFASISAVSLGVAVSALVLGGLYGLVAGFMVLAGRDFRYFILGGLLQESLRMRVRH